MLDCCTGILINFVFQPGHVNMSKIFFKVASVAVMLFASNFSLAGLIGVSEIRITPSTLNTSGWLQVSEVIAYETGTGNDLALASAGATATGSSDWPTSSPDFAIDGVGPTGFPSIFHSNENDGSSFLSIMLDTPSELRFILIFGRTDCCSGRDFFNLELFDITGNSLYTAFDLDATGLRHGAGVRLPDTSVPTPSSLALLALGLAGFSANRKKKSARS